MPKLQIARKPCCRPVGCTAAQGIPQIHKASKEETMKRFVYLLMVLAFLMVPAAGAGAEEPVFAITYARADGNSACFDFTDSLGQITYRSARVAIWDRQDNPSFQTLADWGATLSGTPTVPGGKKYASGTICVPGVLSDHCNKPGKMWIFFKLRDVTKPSRTTARLDWEATCP